MASPQCENGYTRYANELVEAVCSKVSNSTWIRILFWTGRLTYGFKRKETESNYGAYATKLKLTKDTVKSALSEMNDRRLIVCVPTSSEKFIIAINKDYEKWKL